MNNVISYRLPLDYGNSSYCRLSFFDKVLQSSMHGAVIGFQVGTVPAALRLYLIISKEVPLSRDCVWPVRAAFTVYSKLAVRGSFMGGVIGTALGIINAVGLTVSC